MLIRTSIKKNLYYEIKERIDEEQFDGVTVKRRPKKCKVYGSTSSYKKRNELIELLHQRVQHHRDKFATKELYDELCTMVVKPNGKVEHADDAHDDLIFSYLWALYVFYHGEELATRFHLMKTEIYTDDHYDETSYNLEEEYMEGETLDSSVFKSAPDEVSTMIEEQMNVLNSSKRITMEDLYKMQDQEDQKSINKIIQTAPGREAVSKAYHTPLNYVEKQNNMGFVDISDDVMKMWYMDDDDQNSTDPSSSVYIGNMSDMFKRIQ